jgi:hypothetical protein
MWTDWPPDRGLGMNEQEPARLNYESKDDTLRRTLEPKPRRKPEDWPERTLEPQWLVAALVVVVLVVLGCLGLMGLLMGALWVPQ